jgi:hypothetical protein
MAQNTNSKAKYLLVRFLEYSNPLSQSLYWSRRERMGGGDL